MIQDRGSFLTAKAGEAFAAGTAYGSTRFSINEDAVVGAQNDPAVGEPLEVFIEPTVNSDVGTSIRVSLVADTDGAGGSAVVLLDTGVDASTHQSNYTTAKGVRSLGVVPIGKVTSALKYLSLRVIIVGAGGVTMRAWLQKASLARPYNKAGVVTSI